MSENFPTNQNESSQVERISNSEMIKTLDSLRKTVRNGAIIVGAMTFLNSKMAEQAWDSAPVQDVVQALLDSYEKEKLDNNENIQIISPFSSNEADRALSMLDEYENMALQYDPGSMNEMPIRPGYIAGKEYGDAVEYIDDKYGSGVNESDTITFRSPIEQPDPEKIKIIYEFLKGVTTKFENTVPIEMNVDKEGQIEEDLGAAGREIDPGIEELLQRHEKEAAKRTDSSIDTR